MKHYVGHQWARIQENIAQHKTHHEADEETTHVQMHEAENDSGNHHSYMIVLEPLTKQLLQTYAEEAKLIAICDY